LVEILIIIWTGTQELSTSVGHEPVESGYYPLWTTLLLLSLHWCWMHYCGGTWRNGDI